MVDYSIRDQVATHWPKVEELLANPERMRGTALWPGTDSFFGVRYGEVTVIAGLNHSGKSTLTTQFLCRLCAVQPKTKAVIYSPEMAQPFLSMQFVRQAGGKGLGDPDREQKILSWFSHRVWQLQDEGLTTGELLKNIENKVYQWSGVRWVVIDSMMTFPDLVGDDYKGQKRFMQSLMQMARGLEIHIFLICHYRKPDRAAGRKDFTRYDIRGAGEVSDLADNVLLVWREPMENGKSVVILERDKERFSPGRTVHEMALNFDHASAQLSPEHQVPQRYWS